ncbi:uncharacterized protein LOC131144930 [Malania oleifera]|uniref:uncharacterized protein LOC131144930 n=1 Tax=Malania oleifera TaxID=397392 RepID=UPI0025ADA1C5|nr:uncharacterized protein LOC131144930 [Malania oleifera]
MAGATARISAGRRLLIHCEFSGQPTASLSDMDFGFLEEGGDGSQESSGSEGCCGNVDVSGMMEEDGDEERESCGNAEENSAFWESQHQFLQTTLCRSSALEAKIRNATKEALKEARMAGAAVCVCGRPATGGGCRICEMREVCARLQSAGFNCAICKTKWRSSPDIPSGEHRFLDVVEKSSSKRGGEMRVIIETNFRAEFEMARASEEYSRLVRRLPEVFVGKVERAEGVIRAVCAAAKRCMKQRKMHMGPWRKQRYMQAKWLSPVCERTAFTPSTLFMSSMNATGSDRDYLRSSSSSSNSSSSGGPQELQKPRASMLTMDLLEKLPNLHCTAVEVV